MEEDSIMTDEGVEVSTGRLPGTIVLDFDPEESFPILGPSDDQPAGQSFGLPEELSMKQAMLVLYSLGRLAQNKRDQKMNQED